MSLEVGDVENVRRGEGRSQLPTAVVTMVRHLIARLRMYLTLVKSLQTGLLLVTGVAGYLSARCPTRSWLMLLTVVGTLFLAIAGSTVLNMVYDRDIDAMMERVCQRPLPTRRVSVAEALALGSLLSILGIGWSLSVGPLYGAVVVLGWFFDVVVYTIWLKRRTPWSILWGGIAGAMPTLAGRVFGTGQIDMIGVLLAISVLLWIPTHMATFGMKYVNQYRAAGVPVLASRYGLWITRLTIALSTIVAVGAMLLAAWQIGLPWRYFHLALWLGAVLLAFTLLTLVRQSPSLNYTLYKFASLYMAGSMLLIALGSEL